MSDVPAGIVWAELVDAVEARRTARFVFGEALDRLSVLRSALAVGGVERDAALACLRGWPDAAAALAAELLDVAIDQAYRRRAVLALRSIPPMDLRERVHEAGDRVRNVGSATDPHDIDAVAAVLVELGQWSLLGELVRNAGHRGGDRLRDIVRRYRQFLVFVDD